MTLTIGELADEIFGSDAPFALAAYDGSRGGNPNADIVLKLKTERGLRYLVTAPGELGLARAYVQGDLDIDGIDQGDPYDLLVRAKDKLAPKIPDPRRLADIVRTLGPRMFVPPELPAQENPPGWRRLAEGVRHSKARDARAIAHHYDVSNRFYELVLGPSMAYTCACYPSQGATLEQAQEFKFDLVCRKLGLRPGMRLLDVGCGWGGMVRHAVKNYGVRALGVTLSGEQAAYGQEWIEREGLGDLAQIRHGDYRDVTESGFEAVSSIGLTEHIGVRNYPAYFGFLAERLVSGGLLLNHCITSPNTAWGQITKGGFINRYVFPDGELAPVGTIIGAMADQGFEMRHAEDLREHYARTCREWARNLSANWEAAVAEAGPGTARIWGLYLSGSSLGFERGEIQLHQVLGQKVGPGGVAPYPLRPSFGS
ncbi:MAG TPA: class I SAM-dependent methyltransferase [Tetrasphaera sp.]|uniref:class I SAM-dependent methyltransferase n=1 Tax=Nostocoides sp. TaxID=1917966 RepID=UPI002CAEC69B|nr:class I SAM-dependent methyltransferase [Tetrasphaera sp.]HNQ06000.1 class I SAM-dependent methyltransferase [Tetrasphaera sp.]